jgi:alkanesulfonate monooxygenase SsuD/methylene tetrahydromethanopterin reductase-like flavin-dependent oxidoreductase (luciferase family)
MMPLHPLGKPHAECIDHDLATIELADRLGYEEVWVGEHYTNPYENVPCSELILAAALQRTERIRVGTGVSCLPQHNPVALAHRIAMLDHMARGRFNWGIGSGGQPGDIALFRLDEGRSREEISREVLETILALWEAIGDGSAPGMESANELWRFRVPPEESFTRLHLRPYQLPHPPIAVAGVSPSSPTLRLAGERGWIPLSINLVPQRILLTHWAAVEEGARSTGVEADRRRWGVSRDVHIAETTEQARREAKEGAIGYTYSQFTLPLLSQLGLGLVKTEEDLPDSAIDLDYMLDTIAITGDPDEVVRRIEELYDAVGGFGTLLQIAYDWDDREDVNRRSMELLATEVMPRLAHLTGAAA